MSVKLYVGNIPWRTSVDELRDLFAAYGNVEVRAAIKADLGPVGRGQASLGPARPALDQPVLKCMCWAPLLPRRTASSPRTVRVAGLVASPL
jgi:RNA recognition motif-containing protein